MERFEKAVFTNMCMVYDDCGNVLVQDRVDEDWGGITFPGGHVEKREDFTDAVIREVFEETGLRISRPRLCGIKQWTREDGSRYVVLCYKTDCYEGTLVSSEEGEMTWVKMEDLEKMPLARGMNYMLRLFLDDDISEHSFCMCDGSRVDVLK